MSLLPEVYHDAVTWHLHLLYIVVILLLLYSHGKELYYNVDINSIHPTACDMVQSFCILAWTWICRNGLCIQLNHVLIIFINTFVHESAVEYRIKVTYSPF